MIREAETEEIGINIGEKLVYNLRYTDDTALCAESRGQAETLIGKVNNIGKARIPNYKKITTKLLKIGKIQYDA